MFGKYTAPFSQKILESVLSFQKEDEHFVYRRRQDGVLVEKNLLHSGKGLHILPVEPVNVPKHITPFLLIELTRPIFLESRMEEMVFLTFPLEVGVLVSLRKTDEVIDIFSPTRQKYTLYGEPRTGQICRYWKSAVYAKEPDPLSRGEGIIRLTLKNTTADWVHLKQVVLNAFGMKIFYDGNRVAQSATMKILGPKSADTDLLESPYARNMKKSVELYTLRKQLISTPRFSMREGI